MCPSKTFGSALARGPDPVMDFLCLSRLVESRDLPCPFSSKSTESAYISDFQVWTSVAKILVPCQGIHRLDLRCSSIQCFIRPPWVKHPVPLTQVCPLIKVMDLHLQGVLLPVMNFHCLSRLVVILILIVACEL